MGIFIYHPQLPLTFEKVGALLGNSSRDVFLNFIHNYSNVENIKRNVENIKMALKLIINIISFK